MKAGVKYSTMSWMSTTKREHNNGGLNNETGTNDFSTE